MKCKYLIVLLGWALCSTACPGREHSVMYDGFFNPRLRPDLASFNIALPPSDPNYFTYEPGSYYTAGGDKGDEFVSPIFFTFSGGDGRHKDLEGLHHSECFWMHANDRAHVAWEVVGKFRPRADCEDCPELHPEKNVAGACNLGHPYTRSPMETVEGEQLPMAEELDGDLGDFRFVKVHRFHFGSGALDRSLYTDQYNECRFTTPPLQEAVAVLDGPCASDVEGAFALCMKHGCHIPIPNDSSLMFELDARLEGLGGAYNRFYPEPHIKVVNQPRTLSRPMRHDGSRGGTTPASIFSWTVPVLENNRWQENFSPSLKVLKLKTFKRAANGQITHIQPIHYDVNGLFCDQPRQTSDHDIFNVCQLSHHLYTPTYAHVDKDTPLTWTMLFDPGDAGAGDEVFVEFTVSDAVGPEDEVLLSPLALDFGRVVTGTRMTRQIFVENTGRTDIRVDQFVQISDNATEFALQLPAVPFTLAPGDLMALDVSAIPAGTGSSEKSMTVEVVATGVVSGQEVKSQMEMQYQEISGARAHVMPVPLKFFRDPCESARRYRRTMVLDNVGHVPMTRRDLPRIEGAVPDAFQVISTHDQTATYEPAGYEDFRVEFDPGLINGAPGDYAAELVFDTDATSAVEESTYFSNGEIRLPLEGHYSLSCQ